MNSRHTEKCVATALDTLRELGLDAERASRSSAKSDGTISLNKDGRTIRYDIECKARVAPSVVGSIALAFEASENRLLVTDYVTPPLADEFRRRRIQFVDAAGNAFLDCRGIFVFVSGRRPQGRQSAPRLPRAFSRSGLKVGFVLLSAPTLASAPQRSIAQAANVALGSVAVVMDALRELGFIVEIRGARKLVNRERLIDQWTEAYARQLAPTLDIARFSTSKADWWRHADLAAHGAQWGGETAAALLQKHLVPERAILYADEVPAGLLTKYRLRADSSGPVFIRRRFWNAVPSPRADVVPPLLIYADLVTAGDSRSLDGAMRIRDSYLV